MAVAAILNYNFVMLDHPRSPFVHLKFPFKFHVEEFDTVVLFLGFWLLLCWAGCEEVR